MINRHLFLLLIFAGTTQAADNLAIKPEAMLLLQQTLDNTSVENLSGASKQLKLQGVANFVERTMQYIDEARSLFNTLEQQAAEIETKIDLLGIKNQKMITFSSDLKKCLIMRKKLCEWFDLSKNTDFKKVQTLHILTTRLIYINYDDLIRIDEEFSTVVKRTVIPHPENPEQPYYLFENFL